MTRSKMQEKEPLNVGTALNKLKTRSEKVSSLTVGRKN